MTVVVAVLFAVFGSGVSLCAVVTNDTAVAVVGVKMVVHVIVPPTASGFAAGVQLVAAPAGVPPGKVTLQVAFAPGLGPVFVHIVVTVTGVPIVAGTMVGALACMSAIATGVRTQCGSFAGHETGGVHGLAVQPFGSGGTEQVAPVQLAGSVISFATNNVPSASTLAAFTVTFTLAVPGVAPACAGTVAKTIGQRVPAASPPVHVLVAVVVPFVTDTKVVFAGMTSLIV